MPNTDLESLASTLATARQSRTLTGTEYKIGATREAAQPAGEWVSTDMCLGVIEARAGSSVEAELSSCGTIGYAFQ